MIEKHTLVALVYGKVMTKRNTKKNKKSELKKAENKIKDIYSSFKKEREEEKHGKDYLG